MNWAVLLIIVGVIIVAGSFIFAITNIGKQAKNIASGDFDKAFGNFGEIFSRHATAMVVTVIGALFIIIGALIEFLQ